jgi:hypothetical protein
MKSTTKFFLLFVTGLVITGFGVGGVEGSTNTQQLVASVFTAGLGLLMIYLSTIYAEE